MLNRHLGETALHHQAPRPLPDANNHNYASLMALCIFHAHHQGCASSQVTLRQGFEVMLKRVAPEIEEIVDTTNHTAGKQPFYPRNEVPL